MPDVAVAAVFVLVNTASWFAWALGDEIPRPDPFASFLVLALASYQALRSTFAGNVQRWNPSRIQWASVAVLSIGVLVGAVSAALTDLQQVVQVTGLLVESLGAGLAVYAAVVARRVGKSGGWRGVGASPLAGAEDDID